MSLPRNRKCIARGCGVTFATHPSIKLILFPKEGDRRFKEWMRIAGNPPKRKGYLLCTRHFSARDFYDPYRTRIVRGSVPRFPSGRLSPGGQSYEAAEVPVSERRSFMEIFVDNIKVKEEIFEMTENEHRTQDPILRPSSSEEVDEKKPAD